jgi:phage head maturation protease
MEMDSVIGGAVKSDRLGHVKGYLVRFGSPNAVDLEGDFFGPETDFGFPVKAGSRVPLNLYYHHGMDQKVGRKSIGTGYVKMDETGLWYEAQIDLADEYGRMIAKLAKEGKMGFSSGAAGHLVERKSTGIASQIVRWPIAEASITPTPAEWRNTVKSIEDYYGMGMEDEMEEMEEMVPPPAPDQSPEDFANAAFADMKFEMLHEAIEGHYEALCAAIDSLADIEQDRLPFVLALLDAFAGKVGLVAESLELDVKSLRMVSPETLRNTERRLRDAIGLSRSDAKRLAPEIWTLLRDAGQTTDPEPIAEVEVKSSPDSERDDILARLGLLMELK